MEKAKWIWAADAAGSDVYAKFTQTFAAEKNAVLKISCDSNYCAFVNGKLAAFGQYADYPHFKVYDEIDISPFLKEGENRFTAVVWYYGVDSSTYVNNKAGLIYEIESNGKIAAYSSENTLSAKAEDFVCGRNKLITVQLGLSFCMDARFYDGFDRADFSPEGYKKSVIVAGMPDILHKNRIEKLVLSPVRKAACVNETKRIYDLGRESAGFLKCRLKAAAGEIVRVCYGEHLADGEVRRVIGDRDFSAELVGNGEFFEYFHPFRRLGCRYLQIEGACEVDYIGVADTDYPVKEIRRTFADPLLQKIYDVSVHTLRLCMHEHYEDCPWREQALYAMDSRNQMLCGYYAFGETRFPRANLELMSKAQKADKLLPLCFPAGTDTPIPFFSLIYLKEMREYAEYSGDLSLLKENFRLLEEIVGVFVSRMEENGLIAAFEGYWNFYEWSDGMDGVADGKLIPDVYKKSYDLPLNCFVVLALKDLKKIAAMTGNAFAFEGAAEKIRAAFPLFYVKEKGLYRTYLGKEEHFGKLTNYLAVLADPENPLNAGLIARLKADKTMEDVTLSMKVFEFDALLAADPANGAYVTEKIKEDYGFMLSRGATSFWETIKGEADFGGAGSLCHGWSAIPAYYLSRLCENEAKEN